MRRHLRGAGFGATAALLVVAVLASGAQPAAGTGGGPAGAAGTVRAAAVGGDQTPADGVLFGAALPTTGSSQATENALSAQEAVLGRKLDLHRVYRLWDDPLPDSVVSTDLRRGRTPVLSIKPRYRSGQQVSWAAIARGDADPVIAKQADGLRALPGQLFLSLHHEPDLGSNSSYGTPAEYVAAWRHYRQVFVDRGVTNLAFVWIVTTATFGRAGLTDSYYPGDDVVDWIAVDAFNWFGCSSGMPTGWRSLATVTAPFAAWAEKHGKPLMLAEWGSMEDPAQPGRKAAWIRDALALARSWPQLKAMSYLDAYGNCPWPVDSSPSAEAAFVEIGTDPYTHPRPSALLVASARLGPAPFSVRFDGSDSAGTGAASGAGVTGWTVDFGDGSAATGPGQPPAALVHTYPAGVFSARLTIVDGAGRVDRDEGSIRSAGPPVVTSGVRDVTGTSATLRAWVSPQGLAATARFEWGTSTGYGQRSPLLTVAATTGTVSLAVPIGGLSRGTRYYWRVVASNAAGATTRAATVSTTGAPTVSYGWPSSVTSSTAVLNGHVHPHSLDTRYHYEFGTTSRYGTRTGSAPLAAATWQWSAPASLTGLTWRRTYHYRLVATNAAGTVRGSDQVFMTR